MAHPRTEPGCLRLDQHGPLGAAAADGGLRIIALPCDAPRWAMPHWNDAPVRGSGRLADFSAFVRELVERYGTRGSFWQEHPELHARPIRYYDIWNEPYERRFGRASSGSRRVCADVQGSREDGEARGSQSTLPAGGRHARSGRLSR